MNPSCPTDCRLVLTTFATLEEAESVAERVVVERLAACATAIPQAVSKYVWEGRLETSREVLLLLKTVSSLIPALMGRIRALHSYSVPEIVVLDIAAGHPPYLDWVRASTTEPSSPS